MKSRRSFLRLFSGSTILFTGIRSAWSAPAYRNSGWLQLRYFKGDAIYQRRRTRQKAWQGMRLWRTGSIFETGQGAEALFDLDENLGTIHVSEQTRFQIKALHKTFSGGRVTLINVLQGQVRLKVRPMNHPSSRLEVETPAGMNGVRGTEFGISVQPSGKASVATLSGQVDTSALDTTMAIEKGLQTLTMPGEAPLPPTPLLEQATMQVSQSKIEAGVLKLIGKTDPVNSILLNGKAQNTDREGNFSISSPIDDLAFVQLRVITPLGTQKDYRLPVL